MKTFAQPKSGTQSRQVVKIMEQGHVHTTTDVLNTVLYIAQVRRLMTDLAQMKAQDPDGYYQLYSSSQW